MHEFMNLQLNYELICNNILLSINDSSKTPTIEKREYETKEEAKQAFKELLKDKVGFSTLWNGSEFHMFYS